MIALLRRAAAWHLFFRAVEGTRAGRPVITAHDALADRRLLSFARGLSLGALVGAAIAGSAIWGRLRRQPR
jgi:hypothetical protein